MATIKLNIEINAMLPVLPSDHWEDMLRLAKILDRARPVGLTEQREIEELRQARLVESCEGTPVCAVAEKARDNYSN